MYHSVNFGDKNTWDDYHLIPTSRPVINPPALKTNKLSIPGASGVLDLSEALTGYPLYDNRTGSIEFIVENGFMPWEILYSRLLNELSGQKMRVILEDDPRYFYEGRVVVNDWKSNNNGTWSNVTFDYDLGPYKWDVNSSLDEWLWDPFSFVDGFIKTSVFKNISVPSNVLWTTKTLTRKEYDYAPVCPTFKISTTAKNGMDVKYVNSALGINETRHLPDGNTQIFEWLFVGNSTELSFKGAGTVSIDFRNGRL